MLHHVTVVVCLPKLRILLDELEPERKRRDGILSRV